jgi:hypothetical protein
MVKVLWVPAVLLMLAAGGAASGQGVPPVPPSSWVIHINQEGRFAVHHPGGWSVRETRAPAFRVALVPPGESGGIVITLTPAAPPADLPNAMCRRVLVSQLPAVRCRDTVAGTVVTVLPDTSQGTFTFEVSTGSPAYRDYDQVLATFQLLRGA